jgi:serine/threonine-protein kinase SRPK3
MLQRLGKFAQEADHPGLGFTRLASDVFEIDGPSGRHYCIATKPQGNSLRTLQETFANAILPKLLVKSLMVFCELAARNLWRYTLWYAQTRRFV